MRLQKNAQGSGKAKAIPLTRALAFQFALATAFCVSASAATLPSGYRELEYVETDGNQRIITGYKPTDGTETFEMRLMFSRVSGTQTLWCSRGTSTTVNTMTTFLISSKFRYDRKSSTSVTSSLAPAANKIYTVTVDYKACTATATDESTGVTTTTTGLGAGDFTSGNEVGLFASHYNGINANLNNYCYCRLYHFKVTKADGTVACNLVPAVQISNGFLGLYDTTNSKFILITKKAATPGTDFKPGPAVMPEATAKWTNAAGDGALDNPANWSGNAVPASNADVKISLSGDVALSASSALAFNSMAVTGSGAADFPSNVTAKYIDLGEDTEATFHAIGTLVDGGLSGKGTYALDPGKGTTVTMKNSNSTYLGEAVVKSGTMKFGNRSSFGFGGQTNSDRSKTTAGTAKLRVKGGATLDATIGSLQNWTGWPCTSTVLEEGASLVSSSTHNDVDAVALATPLKLEGDATLSNTGKRFQFGTRSYASNSYGFLDIGEHTLTLEGSATTYFNTCATRGDGIIDVTAGTLCLRGGGGVNINGARPHTTLTNGLVKIRSDVKLQVSKGDQNTAAKIKNLQLDGTGTVDASQSLTVTGFLTGGGSINRVTLASGATFKPDGTNFFTITDTLTGTLKLDADDAIAGATGEIPLVRIPAAKAESLAIEDIPSRWHVKWTDDGDYKACSLGRVGFMIIIR